MNWCSVRRIPFLISVCSFLLFLCPVSQVWAGESIHREYTFFKDTQYPLLVHFIQGEFPGPTIMIQGGIQGDENAGFISAQILTRTTVHKGNLLIVPRADIPSIHIQQRQFNVDLNRRFDKDYDRYFEDRLARAIRFLIGKCDGFIHLHEGSGFYAPTRVDDLHGPHRYGQSVIIDTDVYQNRLFLARMSEKVLKKINRDVIPEKYAFHLFNTRTFSSSTPYIEQQKSLSFYAVKHLNIPALAIEVSKNIYDLPWKVRNQITVVKGFLDEMGVSCTLPQVDSDEIRNWYSLPVPLLLNGKPLPRGPVTLKACVPFTLELGHGTSVGAERGCAVFASDRPGYNLLNTQYIPLHPFNSLSVVLDGKKVVRIPVRWKGKWPSTQNTSSPLWVYSLNDKMGYAPSGGWVDVYEGDQLILEGIWQGKKNELLNIKGFLSDRMVNTGQDAGTPLLIGKENFIPRYLTIRKDFWEFRVVRETGNTHDATLRFRVFPRSVKALELLDTADARMIIPASMKEIQIQPGTYRLSDIWAQGDQRDTLVMLDDWPVADEPIVWNPGDSHRLYLYGSRDFKPLHDILVHAAPPIVVTSPIARAE